jgi:hypothetical protein
MSDTKVKCPNCGSQFGLSEGLTLELNSIKEEARIMTEKMVMAKHEEEIERRKKLWEEQQKLELEKVRTSQALKLQEEKLKIERELLKKNESQTNEMLKKQAQEFELRIQEEKIKNETLAKRIEEANRAASKSGSQRNQGEALEQLGEQWLAENFIGDEITPVKTGAKGADVIHKVILDSGNQAGIIKWEFKRVQNWSNAWVSKLEEDMRKIGASIGVIVTEALPSGVELFKVEGNVWIMSINSYKLLAEVVRDLIVRVNRTEIVANASKDLKSEVFNYITGNEFLGHLRGLITPLIGMQETLEKEKRSLARIHSEREKQIKGALNSIADLYGGLQGVSKRSLSKVEELDFIDS